MVGKVGFEPTTSGSQSNIRNKYKLYLYNTIFCYIFIWWAGLESNQRCFCLWEIYSLLPSPLGIPTHNLIYFIGGKAENRTLFYRATTCRATIASPSPYLAGAKRIGLFSLVLETKAQPLYQTPMLL